MVKTRLLFLLFSLLSLQALGQALRYKKVESYDLTYLLNNIEKTTDFKSSESDLRVKVYLVSDPSGSAQTGETDEVTTSIYFAVSEYDQAPEQYVYRLTSVYNPKFVKWIKEAGGPKLLITYGAYNKIRTATIKVSLKRLIIITK